ncbi:MAG TPA: hypothetical protein VIK78_13010 [Ruminiclostridium sp.]
MTKILNKNSPEPLAEVLSQVRICVMRDSSDFLDIKEYSRELGEVIYPNVRKNPSRINGHRLF